MESFGKIFNRFVRLLPFLPGPYYRRFHHELFYPYPDVWHDPDEASTFHAAPGHPIALFGGSGVGRARVPRHPVSHHAHPYLRWIEMNSSGDHRGEPFC